MNLPYIQIPVLINYRIRLNSSKFAVEYIPLPDSLFVYYSKKSPIKIKPVSDYLGNLIRF